MRNVDAVILETLETYMEMLEKQEDIICQLSKIVKKQAYEIAHLKNLYGFSDLSSEEEIVAQQTMDEYEQLKNQEKEPAGLFF